MNYYETFGSYVFPYSSDKETKKEHNFARDLFRLVSMSKRKYLLCSNNYWVGCYALDFNSWINILSKSEEKRTRKTHTSVENRLGHEYEIQLMDENFLFCVVICACVCVCMCAYFLYFSLFRFFAFFLFYFARVRSFMEIEYSVWYGNQINLWVFFEMYTTSNTSVRYLCSI